MCQLATGSPVAAFFTVPEAHVRFEGKLGTYQSSEKAVRKFCTECGTPLVYQLQGDYANKGTHMLKQEAPEIEICVATLVTPSVLVPNEHYWLKSKQPWLELGDSLPKYLKNDRE